MLKKLKALVGCRLFAMILLLAVIISSSTPCILEVTQWFNMTAMNTQVEENMLSSVGALFQIPLLLVQISLLAMNSRGKDWAAAILGAITLGLFVPGWHLTGVVHGSMAEAFGQSVSFRLTDMAIVALALCVCAFAVEVWILIRFRKDRQNKPGGMNDAPADHKQ